MLTGILQPTHLIILLGVALIFLGPKRLPDAGRALGPGTQGVQGLDRAGAAARRDAGGCAARRDAAGSVTSPASGRRAARVENA